MTNYTNVAIVTFYDDKERYILGAKRQKESLKSIGFPMENYFQFNSCAELGCPEHTEIPYAFKPAAIEKVREKGFDIVIWMDSPVYAIKPIDKFIEHIRERGYIFFDNLGYTIGDYTSDECLKQCNVTREEAFKKPMIMACLMGFNFNVPVSRYSFKVYSEITDLYKGDWTNEANQVSTDNRVKGHRHDQSVMSLILADYGIKPIHPHSTFFAYFGNPGHLPHAESVCLISQGY